MSRIECTESSRCVASRTGGRLGKKQGRDVLTRPMFATSYFPVILTRVFDLCLNKCIRPDDYSISRGDSTAAPKSVFGISALYARNLLLLILSPPPPTPSHVTMSSRKQVLLLKFLLFVCLLLLLPFPFFLLLLLLPSYPLSSFIIIYLFILYSRSKFVTCKL